MAIYTALSCSLSDVQNAYDLASSGDTVIIPAGSATWGTGNTSLSLFTPGVIIQGQGDSTIITLDDSGPTFGNGVFTVSSSNIVIKRFKVQASNIHAVTLFNLSGSGCRISQITYIGGTAGNGYFVYSSATDGLIDSCIFNGNSGSNELIFGRGPTNAWQVPNTLGSATNIFIESNVFNGAAYVCDANSNAHFVVRYNIINGTIKVDGHGLASNTPARSFRNIEIYGNLWTHAGDFYSAIEVRGGTSRIFNNTAVAPNGGGTSWFILTDYGYLSQWPNFGNVYQTPVNYPISDQVGTGEDPQTAAEEPAYIWNNKQSGGSAPWVRAYKQIPTAAISLYQMQTSNPSATFTDATLIQSNRDFYADAGFDTNTGVSVGTTLQMNALTPGIIGYGFFVTDQGSWNSYGTSGLLYIWNGSNWILNYTPYFYPHPLRDGDPTPDPVVLPQGEVNIPNTILISMSNSNPTAIIYYTLDGTDPLINSLFNPNFSGYIVFR